MKHLAEVLELVEAGQDPVAHFERKKVGTSNDNWGPVPSFMELFNPEYQYREGPFIVTINGRDFQMPRTYVPGKDYWIINLGAPDNPAKNTYKPGNATLRYCAERKLMTETKKQAADMGREYGLLNSRGGTK